MLSADFYFFILSSFSIPIGVLTGDLAGVVEGDVIVSAAALQLLLLLQQGHAHQVEHLYTHRECTGVPQSTLQCYSRAQYCLN